MKRVLIATAVPYWHRQKGNQQRIFELVSFLAAHYSVTVFYMGQEQPPNDNLNVSYITTNPYGVWTDFAWRFLNWMPTRLRTRMVRTLNDLSYRRTMKAFYNARVADEFRRIYAANHYHAVVIEYIWYGFLADAIDKDRSISFLDVHDVFHKRVESFARFGRVPDKVVNENEELGVYRKFDYLIAIQRVEFDYLNGLFPGKALLAMHPQQANPDIYGKRLDALRPGDKLNLVYFGSFGDLNLDAVNWFVERVWSSDLADRFVLNIYGAICDALTIDVPGIFIKGCIEDLRDAYRDADIAINPIRFGSGLKIKNVEALAYGVPVVTTSVGAEGLEEGVDEFLLCADDADGFRAQIFKLADESMRRSISEKALAFVSDKLTHEVCFGAIKQIIDEEPSDRE